MNKLSFLKPKYVEFMPESLDSGILFISLIYEIAIHLCACGCGTKVVTPLDKIHGWELEQKDGGTTISLHPSIGNYQIPCKTHYFIKNNEIIWLDPFD